MRGPYVKLYPNNPLLGSEIIISDDSFISFKTSKDPSMNVIFL